ncbi:hypothetical protein [Amycolatopsis balhimycina]|nr:hypothetical protein [Amycolatopsis balhimycina]
MVVEAAWTTALAVATQIVAGLVNRRRSRAILATAIEALEPKR